MVVDTKNFVELFIAGITLGFGPCFLFCAPLTSSYIFAKEFNCKKGLLFTIIFSLGRITAYSILAVVAVAFINTLEIQKNIFKQVAGFIILLTLPAYSLFKNNVKFCNLFCNYFGKNTQNYGTFLLGVFIGLTPCAPLAGVLTYIVCKSENIFDGFFNGLIFGIGTLFSPLILVGLLGGIFNLYISKTKKISWIFKIIANCVIIYFGLKFIL
ncbi:MAG: sulfite exporter TauE/SafE family protein [Elusimicrobiota bacterium]